MVHASRVAHLGPFFLRKTTLLVPVSFRLVSPLHSFRPPAQLAPRSAAHVSEQPIFVSLATAISLPRTANVFPHARPTRSLLLEHVPLVIQTVRPALGLHSVSAALARRIDQYFRMAVVSQPVPRPSFSTAPVEAARHAIAAVRVVQAQGPAIVSRAQVRPRSSAGDPARPRTAAPMQQPSYPDWACASRTSSPSHKYQAHPSRSLCPPSQALTRQR